MAKKETKNNKKENNKNKKSFAKDFKAELKKVIWPTPKQLSNNTVAVITIVLITAAIVFVLDFAFKTVNEYSVDQVNKLITTIENKETEGQEENQEESSEETENVETEENVEETVNNEENNTENNAE